MSAKILVLLSARVSTLSVGAQGSSKRELPWQVTMDQLICAPLSYTHYWYEVGMFKDPARYTSNVFVEGTAVLYLAYLFQAIPTYDDSLQIMVLKVILQERIFH